MIPQKYIEIFGRNNITLQQFDFSELKEVLKDFSKKKKKSIKYNINGKEFLVKVCSKRYPVFVKNNSCEICGINGNYLLLETNIESVKRKRAHFNLYGIEDGKLLLMTVDHILPRKWGGNDYVGNLRTLCCLCNNIRGHDFIDNVVIKNRDRVKNKILERALVRSKIYGNIYG